MTSPDQPQPSGSASAEPAEGTEPAATPVVRMLANPRRVRRT